MFSADIKIASKKKFFFSSSFRLTALYRRLSLSFQQTRPRLQHPSAKCLTLTHGLRVAPLFTHAERSIVFQVAPHTLEHVTGLAQSRRPAFPRLLFGWTHGPDQCPPALRGASDEFFFLWCLVGVGKRRGSVCFQHETSPQLWAFT